MCGTRHDHPGRKSDGADAHTHTHTHKHTQETGGDTDLEFPGHVPGVVAAVGGDDHHAAQVPTCAVRVCVCVCVCLCGPGCQARGDVV